MRYDAIIIGASFAGLAVANQLKGNILLIDRKDIGTSQTSACGTLLKVPQSLGLQDSILQTFNVGFIHTPLRTVKFPLPFHLCTIDYQKFCQVLMSRLQVRFLKAQVKGVSDGSVVTDAGIFQGTCLIDASGWRTVLASSPGKNLVDRNRMSFGIEAEVPYPEEAQHFWMKPGLIKQGVTWLFPCGRYSRIGIGSYVGETRLGEKLASFLEELHLQPYHIHGGFFPWKLRRFTIGKVFVVGDAAGQCTPLTGEGIRPALYFGSRCGQIVQHVIDQRISLDEGLSRYGELAIPYKPYYSFLEKAQRRLSLLPSFWLTWLLTLLSYRPLSHFILNAYISPPGKTKLKRRSDY